MNLVNSYRQMPTQSWLMDKKQNHNLLYYTPAIGWGILICYFSLMPGKELPGFLLNATDVVLHFLIYLLLTLLFLLGKNRFSLKATTNRFLLFAIAGIFVMGIFIEVLQENYVEGRHFEWGDILFNTLGSLAVLVINRFLK